MIQFLQKTVGSILHKSRSYIPINCARNLTLANSQVLISEDNTVKTVILSSPATRNSLSLAMLKELKESILVNDSSKRCIILKAEGKVFSSGHNLKELLTGPNSSNDIQEIMNCCSELMQGISEIPIPVIAQVNGIAAAAGCQLVASCDIALASDTSSFVTPGANAGIFCSTPGIPLVRNVPRKVAADMLLTGLPISAQTAFNVGLISAVVPEGELDYETQKRVEAICAKSKAVLALGKRFMYTQMNMSVEDAYREGSKVMVNNIHMKDGQEGIRSFAEKRKPVWTHQD